MKATIYHNPQCGTSRKTLEILQAEGADVTVIEYLKQPPAREELKRLYERAGMKPSSEEAILDAMVEYPILINRPLVETEKGVRLCRPQEVVREIL